MRSRRLLTTLCLSALMPFTASGQNPQPFAPAQLPKAEPALSPNPVVAPAAAPSCPEPAPPFFTPFMLGDFIGPVTNMFGQIKIAEGESPRPVDRVYYRFNYYDNLNPARWTDPRESIKSVNLYQSTLGFEKTFADKQYSIGLRIPFYTLAATGKDPREVLPRVPGDQYLPAGPAETRQEFGNINAIVKAVVWEDRKTGSMASAGATISFPTATSTDVTTGQSIVSYLQPYGGFIYNVDDFYVQGFSSMTLPLVRPQAIVMFNDVGAGYYVYRNHTGSGMLESVAPTLEMHLTTPIRQADFTQNSQYGAVNSLYLNNVLNVTLGTTFVFTNGATLGIGVAAPLTGPRPFDFEALAQLNYRF